MTPVSLEKLRYHLVGHLVTTVYYGLTFVGLSTRGKWLSIFAAWSLRNNDGETIDSIQPTEQRTDFQLGQLLGQIIVGVNHSHRQQTDIFDLELQNGLVLSFEGSSDEEPSWSLNIGKEGDYIYQTGEMKFVPSSNSNNFHRPYPEPDINEATK